MSVGHCLLAKSLWKNYTTHDKIRIHRLSTINEDDARRGKINEKIINY